VSEYGIQAFGKAIDSQNHDDPQLYAQSVGHPSADPMSEEETEAMHGLLLASAPMEWSERDQNGNLRWLKKDGAR
jgi:hypothetical protein